MTDYRIGRDVIYASFSWKLSAEACELARELASKHGAGFFDAGGDGEIILPDGTQIQ